MTQSKISEDTPLLSGKPSAYGPPDTDPCARKVLWLVCGLLAVLDLAVFLAVAPQTEIFQDIACTAFNKHDNGLSNNPVECKSEAVQSEAATVIGWKDTLDQIPSKSFQTCKLFVTNL